ncbi:MAG: GTPase HflX [Desulfobacteraceae bacterium]|nr:GTPase HflX [Desulfobacteraceae bacterium]
MKKLFGNSKGLKSNQIKRLENLYRRKTPTNYIIGRELARDTARLSYEIRRQIGLLIDRGGKIQHVIIGDQQSILIPDTSEYRLAAGRLRGLRCVHTHLKNEPLTSDDLMDLSLLRMDLMAAITITQQGDPEYIHWAQVLPYAADGKAYQVLPHLNPGELDIDCLRTIQALETELSQQQATFDVDGGKERAVLVSISTASKKGARDSMNELADLAKSSNISIARTIIQYRKSVDPRFLMGRGKLRELAILALQEGATLIIFDQDLNPSQIRSITDQIELKVIDRTQLILDIFALRAKTRDGKLQVELAQLKYLLPRLIAKNTAMSRLTGGIGGRGPGETKLEVNRRRVRDKINRLEKALKQVQNQRKQKRRLREKRELPLVSIIGYTNAGKSTLLNTLTKSKVRAENRLFATLDPSSRRLKFPKDVEVIISDTVGFIRDLPKDLMAAFRATLEELEVSDVLLHVIDVSNPRCIDQMDAVDRIVVDLNLSHLPKVIALNKIDLVATDVVEKYKRQTRGIPIQANDNRSLVPILTALSAVISDDRDIPSNPL